MGDEYTTRKSVATDTVNPAGDPKVIPLDGLRWWVATRRARLARLLHRLRPRCALCRVPVRRGLRYCDSHENERAQHEEMRR